RAVEAGSCESDVTYVSRVRRLANRLNPSLDARLRTPRLAPLHVHLGDVLPLELDDVTGLERFDISRFVGQVTPVNAIGRGGTNLHPHAFRARRSIARFALSDNKVQPKQRTDRDERLLLRGGNLEGARKKSCRCSAILEFPIGSAKSALHGVAIKRFHNAPEGF